GMAEMSSQFYDRIVGKTAPRLFHSPPQVRTRVLSPETLKPMPRGEVGLLAHADLANIDSAAALLTEDFGREVDGGFLLLGRAAGSEQKGCSITLDELLLRNLPKTSPISG
ncbi:MAG: CoF synthetase, partial [Nitrospiria bacterium]